MTQKHWIRPAGLLVVLLTAACQGPTVDPQHAASFVDDFIAGRAQLPRDNPLALPSPWYTRRVYGLWRSGQWSFLARDVAENGYDIDLNWFYLAEAARGGGFFPAAQIYYQRALADATSWDNNRRCGFFIALSPELQMCTGFIFPRDILLRMR